MGERAPKGSAVSQITYHLWAVMTAQGGLEKQE